MKKVVHSYLISQLLALLLSWSINLTVSALISVKAPNRIGKIKGHFVAVAP
jgi:hypothetical protein